MMQLQCDLEDYGDDSMMACASEDTSLPSSAGTPDASKPPRRVFVVDDYPGLAEAAKLVLEREGFVVSAFHERELALRVFVEIAPRPELLITDYFGGSMSGLGLIRICKAIHPGLKALLVSGVDYRTLSRNELLLLDGVLPKPYSAADLMEQVRRLCDGKSARPLPPRSAAVSALKSRKPWLTRSYPA